MNASSSSNTVLLIVDDLYLLNCNGPAIDAVCALEGSSLQGYYRTGFNCENLLRFEFFGTTALFSDGTHASIVVLSLWLTD